MEFIIGNDEDQKNKFDEEREKANPGLQPAVLISITDLGWQEGEYQKKPWRRPQVALTFELDQEYTDGPLKGERFLLTKIYNKYMTEKANLRKLFSSWEGRWIEDSESKHYNIGKWLGKPALISVKLNKKGYPDFGVDGGIMECPEAQVIHARKPGYVQEWIRDIANKGEGNVHFPEDWEYKHVMEKPSFEDDMPDF